LYTFNVYIIFMIKSFADKETEKIYHQIISRKLPYDIQKVALRKLIMIDNAEGQYSIRINDKWRVCFTLEEKNDFHCVEIVDYH